MPEKHIHHLSIPEVKIKIVYDLENIRTRFVFTTNGVSDQRCGV